jgi:hypothetical protein
VRSLPQSRCDRLRRCPVDAYHRRREPRPWWRPAIKRKIDTVSFVIDGYEPGEELASTEDRRRDGADSWAFLLTLRIEP